MASRLALILDYVYLEVDLIPLAESRVFVKRGLSYLKDWEKYAQYFKGIDIMVDYGRSFRTSAKP